MAYDIIVRFPSKEMADEFCSQMSDGFGEGLCDFSFWERTPTGKAIDSFIYKKVTSSAPLGTPVFFVNWIEEY